MNCETSLIKHVLMSSSSWPGLIAIAEMCHKLLKLDVSRCSNLEKFES